MNSIPQLSNIRERLPYKDILITTSFSLDTGGVKSYVDSLNSALHGCNLNVTVLPNYCKANWTDKAVAALTSLGNRKKARLTLEKLLSQKQVKEIKKTVQDKRIDLIHTQDVVVTSALADIDLPIVMTVHGPMSREIEMLFPDNKDFIQYIKTLEYKAYRRANQIIAVDSGQKQIVLEDRNIDGNKIHVLLNAVNTDLFKPAPVNVGNNPKYILVPRRLVPKNGVAVAIEAMKYLKDINVELWIAGDGPEQEKLIALTESLALSNRVKFLGSVQHTRLIPMLQQATVITIPSVPVSGVVEASSIAALESMATGKTVVASNIGGLAELITHRENGLLFDAGDSEELARLIRAVYSDQTLAEQLGAAARQYVIENQSTKVWVKQVMEVYAKA